jgi:hypothetical protein
MTVASGATMTNAGTLTVSGTYNCTGTFKIGSTTVSATAAQLNFVAGVIAGTAAASKALVLDGSKDIATINSLTSTTLICTNLDAGASGTAGTLDVFPPTAANGKLIISATNNGGARNVTLTNAAHAQTSTYSVQDCGNATGKVWTFTGAQTAAGLLSRGDLVQEDLAVYPIPLYTLRQADMAAMGVGETAGDHYLDESTNVITLLGEVANNETEASVSWFQAAIPAEYVASETVKIRVIHQLTGAGTDNGSTIDLNVYEQTTGAVGSDLNETTAATMSKGSYTTTDFVITDAGLAAGNMLNVKLTTNVIENASSDLQAQIAEISLLCDIKG